MTSRSLDSAGHPAAGDDEEDEELLEEDDEEDELLGEGDEEELGAEASWEAACVSLCRAARPGALDRGGMELHGKEQRRHSWFQ